MSVRDMICAVALCACGARPAAPPPPIPATAREIVLPTRFASDRWFLETTIVGGGTITLFLDSAGGAFLDRSAAQRLHLAITKSKDDDGSELEGVSFPKLTDPRIPVPAIDPYPVIDDDDPSGDGMLGATWFSGRTWTFDYPNKQLILRAPGDLPKVSPEHRIPIGFPRDDSGKVISPYGRIQMIVDGATIDMLLDTGATTHLSPAALTQLPGDADRATSFITKTVFDRWHTAHPSWRVIDKADEIKGAQLPMIEVPTVTIAGYQVGPVWFTWRPDAAFHEFMAQFMDKPSEGALGGSALHYFRVTADWAGGAATFERN